MNATKILAAAILGAGLSGPLCAQAISVDVNGHPVAFQGTGPRMINGHVLVPLRGVMEELGATVLWDQATQQVTVNKGATNIVLRIGAMSANVNGQPMAIGTPATIIDGTTMVPLRFVSETLGANVSWNAVAENVDIRTPQMQTETISMTNTLTSSPNPMRFHDDANGWLTNGGTIHFSLDAKPGGKASVLLPGLSTELPMRETSAGHYEASWSPGDLGTLTVKSATAEAKLVVGGHTYYSSPVANIDFDNEAPSIVSVFPAEGAVISGYRPLISVTYSDEGSGIAPDHIKLTVSGQDVTSSSQVAARSLTYTPPSDLTPGQYQAAVTLTDKAGNSSNRTWSFSVTGSNATSNFTHTGSGTLRPGQAVQFSLKAAPGSQATVHIGNLVNVPLTESSPGELTGSYTIRDGDHFGGDIVTATVTPSNGQQYVLEAPDRMGVSGNISPASMAPIISSPLASQAITDPIVVAGSAPPACTVEIHVSFVTRLDRHSDIRGSLADLTVVADTAGNFQSRPIHVGRLAGAQVTELKITAVTVLPDGTRSPATLLTLHS